jgi:hypothetical protein
MILRWVWVLGLTGFLAGFLGPMVLWPQSHIGPLTGVVITGPGGLLLGLLLGAILALFRVPPSVQRPALLAVAAILGLGALFASIPSPIHEASLIAGEVRACAEPATLRHAVVARLESLDAEHRYHPPVPWSEGFDRALAARPGVVITVQVQRAAEIRRGRAPWNRDRLTARRADPPGTDPALFVDAPDCRDWPAGRQAVLAVYPAAGIWPPATAPEFLAVDLARPAPAEWAGIIAPP